MEENEKYTLIVARKALKVPKTALADGMVEDFSARSRAAMAAFKAEIVLCRSLGHWLWDSACMVENRDSCERAAWREGCEEGREP